MGSVKAHGCVWLEDDAVFIVLSDGDDEVN